MISFLLFQILFSHAQSHAQIAVSSIFPEMKCVNPAVISERKMGLRKAAFQQDFLSREYGEEGTATLDKYDITLSNLNLMAATGKEHRYHYEFNSGYTMGTQKAKLQTSGGTYDIDATAMNARLGMGFNKWGAEVHIVNSALENKQTRTEGGNTIEAGSTEKSSVIGAQIGGIRKLESWKWGWVIGYDSIAITNAEGAKDPEAPTKSLKLGLGIGTGDRRSALEFAVEVDPAIKQRDDAPGVPFKLSLLAEKRIWILNLGIKSMVFMNYFEDIDQPIQNMLVYRPHSGPSRIENVFNFSFVGERGWSVGGSAYYSTTESNTTSASGDTFRAASSGYGYNVGVGYTF